MEIINPTGKGLRVDGGGSGAYGSKRGDRIHAGKDYLCEPGQDVVSPITGRVERFAAPYSGEGWSGLLIAGPEAVVKMYYLQPTVSPGEKVKAGEKIGTAQNIAQKYGGDMKPHIHLELYARVNPELYEE